MKYEPIELTISTENELPVIVHTQYGRPVASFWGAKESEYRIEAARNCARLFVDAFNERNRV